MSDEQIKETSGEDIPAESDQEMTEQPVPVRRKKKKHPSSDSAAGNTAERSGKKPGKKRPKQDASGKADGESAQPRKKKKKPLSEDGSAQTVQSVRKKKDPESLPRRKKSVSGDSAAQKKKQIKAADDSAVQKKKRNTASDDSAVPKKKQKTAADLRRRRKTSTSGSTSKAGTGKKASPEGANSPSFRLSVPAPIQNAIDRREKKKKIESDRLARIAVLKEQYQATDPDNREDIREELSRALRVQKREERKRKEARKEYITIAAAAVVAVFLILLILNRYHLTLDMPDGDAVEAQYGETYEDPKVTASYRGTIFHFRDAEVEVSTTGTVNTDEEGTYELTYTATHKNKSVSATRTVTVADTEAPVIELKTDEDSYTEPGTEYEEEGYTATDNYDGDLTDEVSREERDGVVYYSVTDSHGNTGTAERTIVYDDRSAPVITLDSSVNTVLVDSDWEDSYSAYDDGDGDVTDSVSVEGTVDTSTEGTYTLTYSVTDSSGNEATAERTVSVVYTMEDEVTGPKVIFLTFDDGPGAHTERLLDILAKYNVKATFFVTNQFPDYQDMIAREAEEGHTVAVHSYKHDFEDCYTTDEGYWEDFNKMNDIIEAQTGERTTMFRFPGGSSNTISRNYNEESGIMTRLTEQAAEKGYEYFDWNVSSGDAGQTTDSDEVYENIVSQLDDHDVSVVLVHDIHEYTVDCIEDVITYALNNGYTFMPLSPGIYTCHHGVNN